MASARNFTSRVSIVHRISTGPDPELEWETTKYTKLPRGWLRICREIESFLQNVGLGIIMATYRGTFQSDYVEPKKVTVRRSRLTASFKSLIHVIPVGVSLFEIILNLRGYYRGQSFDDQSWYQLIAKAHEILIDASLSSIILSYIRFQLISEDGLPFGAFLGGLQFLSISYLWSRELWSSLLTGMNVLWKRITFLLLITACGIIAATAGPSSATLLIPRLALWPVKPTYVLINGTAKDIWPDWMDPESVSSHCLVVEKDQTQGDPLCPGANWNNLFTTLQTQTVFSPIDNDSISSLGYYHDTPGPGTQFTATQISSCPMDQTGSQICGTVEPIIGSLAAFNDSENYFQHGEIASYLEIYHSVDKNFYTANTAVRCFSDVVNGPDDASTLQFPLLLRTKDEYQTGTETLSVTSVKKASLYATSGNISDFRVIWMSLPDEPAQALTAGAVVISPQNSTINSSLEITTCTIGAGWGTSSMLTSFSDDGVYFKPTGLPGSYATLLKEQGSTPFGDGSLSFGWPIYANVSGFAYPERPIQLPPQWLAYLNPVSTLQSGTNGTVINDYMSSFPPNLGPLDIAQILTYMLHGGLAISGLNLAWQELPDGPVPCTNCHILEVDHSYYGWAYVPHGTPVKLAVAVMITYCALAIGHIIYLGSTGVSSSSWDSASEIVALAMNSAPTPHLQNTCSGIIGMRPFRTRVRIVATGSIAGEKKDHLELVFGEKGEVVERGKRIEFDAEYGALGAERHLD